MSNQQQTIRNSKRNSERHSPSTKYNYIQTEPDDMETVNQEDEFVRDGNSSLDKQYVGISISDSNFNENQYNDKPQQIPKIKQMRHSKNIIKTLPDPKQEDKKKKTLIKTKVTKFYMEEQKKQIKTVQYKVNQPVKTVERHTEKPIIKTHRVKNNMVKKTIDLNNSNDENTQILQLSLEKQNKSQSLYDQALQQIQKSSPQKHKKMKSIKTGFDKNWGALNSERQQFKPAVFSFNLRPSSENASEEKYKSPQKAPSIDSEMDDQNSDVVVNKIKTQSIDKNKFMRTQDIKLSGSKKLGMKPQVLSSFQNVGGLKNLGSPQKNLSIKSKAQNPVRQKTNSNNIGQLHHSKSNSLSITKSMKIIKPIVKKVEIKKNVQFQPKPMPKKGKFGSGLKNDQEQLINEEKNSFKIAGQKKIEARPMSPRGPNNQQKSLNFDSGNNQDRIFPYEEEKPLTQRFSMNYKHNYNDLESPSILKKNSSIKSPLNIRTQSINSKHVNMVVEQSFAGLPKKIVLPQKNQVVMFQPPYAMNESHQSSRRDRSQTHHQASSFNAGELQPETKTHRLDKQQPKVRFQEHQLEQDFRTSNVSITSARELSSLKQMRDQKKNSKSLLKYHGIASNQSETDGDKLNLCDKLAEIQNQLNQLSELSAQDRGSNHGSRRRLRSTSIRKPGHSTSQKDLLKDGFNLHNFANGLPPRQTVLAETPQPSRFQIRVPTKNAFSNYNQNVVEPNNFNSTTKKVMIDLSSNPDYTRNFNPSNQFSGQGEIEEDYEQSIAFVENFNGNLNMFKNKSQQPRNVHTTMQQPTMMSGGYSSYHQQPIELNLPRNKSKSGRRNIQKHDSMTEKLSRELLQQLNPKKNESGVSGISGEGHVRIKSEKYLNNSGQRQSSSQTRINKKGNLLFQKKQGAGVNFKHLQNDLEV